MKKNRKIIVLVGPSCSGKTTWAKQYIKENTDQFYIVSRDIEREGLFGEYRMGNNKEEALITKICDEKIKRLLESKINVIIDNTHLKKSYITDVVKNYNYLADIEIVKFERASLEELEFRSSLRFEKENKYIPKDVIKKQIEMYDNLLSLDIPKFYPKINQNVQFNNLSKSLPNIYICDIDGTLSTSAHRNIYDATEEEIMDDVLIIPTSLLVSVTTVMSHNSTLGPNVIFMSGRSSKYFNITEKWLKEKISRGRDITLYMRKEGDYRPDTIIKREMYDNHIREKYNVLGVFDDRKCMIDMWNKMGIFTFDVGQGKNYF